MKNKSQNFTNQKIFQQLNQIDNIKNNIGGKELILTTDNLNLNHTETLITIKNKNIHPKSKESNDEIQSISSTISLGFFDLENIYDDISKSAISNEFQPNSFVVDNDHLFDTYCIVITCNVHQKIALQELSNKCLFLPVINLDNENDSFLKLFQDFLANSFPATKRKLYLNFNKCYF